MPLYCYTDEEGNTEELFYPMGKAPESVTLKSGNKAERDFAAEHLPRRAGSGWPMKPCVSTGVNAAQAQDLRNFYKKHGLSIEVSKSGDPIYTSQSQMNKDLKLRGFVDMN